MAGASKAQHDGASIEQSHSKVAKKLAALGANLKAADEDVHIPWVKTERADYFFGIVILANAAFIGIDIEIGAKGWNWGLWITETVFLAIFLVEVVLRVAAERPQIWRFFDAWGTFDTAITLIGCVDAWIVTPLAGSGEGNPLSSLTVLRMMRLVRLVRLIRVLRMFSELVVLIQTIGNSIRAVAWMSLLLSMIMYVGAIVTTLLVGLPHRETDPDVDQHFGSIGKSLFSHFCIVTLEGWPDIATTAMKHNQLWALYFVLMIVLTNFALVNLMVGVIVERIIFEQAEQENELVSFVAESKQFKDTLETLFLTSDYDLSGDVTKDEVRKLLKKQQTHEIFSAFGINLNIPEHTLHTIMGMKGEGVTTFPEFFDACMRMAGSKANIHSVFLQHDICECQEELTSRLGDLQKQIVNLSAKAPSPERIRLAEPPQYAPTAATAIPAAGTALSTGLETTVLELLDRMDRFGQVQQQIVSEMHAVKEHAKVAKADTAVSSSFPPIGGSSQEKTASTGGGGRTTSDRDSELPRLRPGENLNFGFVAENACVQAPALLHKTGQEIGACCQTSLFGMDGLLGQQSQQKSVEARPKPQQPAEPSPGRAAPAPTSTGNSSLAKKKRKELEAEFRSKRGFPGV